MATKKTKTKKTQVEKVAPKDGLIEGEYSKSLWNNGELISFDIDWDKLTEICKNLDKKPAAI
ncbi:MAG: hypothetical protein EBT26_05465 [Microbacteriaceae bacterium]|nr:hypothetical protein [Microbacteriaceae bacterium]